MSAPEAGRSHVDPVGAEGWSRAGWQAHLPGARDFATLVGQLGAQTIPALAAESASRVPDRIAVAIDGEVMSHGALDAGAAQLSGWLQHRLDPGDRVLLAAQASPGFVRCYLGALRAGGIVVLANPAAPTAELARLVSDSGATIAFASIDAARRLAAIGGRLLTMPVEHLPATPGRRVDAGIRARPQDIALLAYTSGTTGQPKGVPLTHRQLATSIRSAMAAWRWSADDVLLHCLPLFHQHGLGGVHAALIAGSTTHIRSRFNAADLMAAGRAEGATVLFAVPTIYQALLGAGSGGIGPALPGLRLAVCGSAPLSPALAARLPGLLGRQPLVRYGTTESGLDISHPCDATDSGTIGVPLPGVLARIWSDGHEAPIGTDGEIQLHGPQIFDGYWRDPEASAASFTTDGWFRTGDVGAVDKGTGHMVIRGRIKDVIITGGMNVYPREVEAALESHASVAEAVVTGVPHEHWGEQVTAWVVLRAGCGLEEEGLLAHTRTLLAPYKCPKRVFTLAAVPRNNLGKVNRDALTARPDL